MRNADWLALFNCLTIANDDLICLTILPFFNDKHVYCINFKYVVCAPTNNLHYTNSQQKIPRNFMSGSFGR